MATEIAAFFEKWHADRQMMKEQAPTLSQGFGSFYQALMKEGALQGERTT